MLSSERLAMNRLVAVLSTAIAICGVATAAEPEFRRPIAPDDTVGEFRLEAGYRIELAACEPEVVDPVEVRFDEQGRMWVVEMRDYPHGPDDGERPRSRIRVLTDEDGDGRYETAHTFAEGLLFANGLEPWRGGVIVTLAGEIVWLKDTTGDGVADQRETWFRGLAEPNPQLRANHPRFGPDGRIYVNNGLRTPEVIDVRDGAEERIDIAGRDFRFDPRGGGLEAVTGLGQFGMTFDAGGERFVCSNRNPLVHAVLPERYVRRNPRLAVTATVHDVSPPAERSRVYPLSRAWTTSTQHAGQYTAASGVAIYEGDLLPELRGSAFTCESTGNLVHREILRPAGATFTGRAATEGVEFLATADEWFRPVNLTVGPDGALYVVDMYRAVIEHPQFMPEELQTRRDLKAGNEHGRIYRIVPDDVKRHAAPQVWDDPSPAALVERLADENAWHRTTAARLLYERGIGDGEASLVELATTGAIPEARIAAIDVLAGQGRVTAKLLETLLDDSHAGVRAVAVPLAETLAAEDASLRERLITLAGDPDPRVRFRVALALGEISVEERVGPLTSIALADADDPWLRRAVATSLVDCAGEVFRRIYEAEGSTESPGRAELIGELAALAAASEDSDRVDALLAAVIDDRGDPQAVRAALLGFADGLRRRGTTLSTALARLGDESAERQVQLTALFEQAAEIAGSKAASIDERVSCIRLLAYAPYAAAGTVLADLIERQDVESVRLAAIEALSAHGADEVADVLLARFEAIPPGAKRAALDALLAHPRRIARLLDAIEGGTIAVTEIDPVRTNRLLGTKDAELKSRAAALLAAARPPDRAEVLKQYQSVLEVAGDAQQGREVFRRNCSTCHQVAEIGTNVGPDIGDSRVLKPAQLLTDILDPNRAIDANYIAYAVVTTDGRSLSGVVRGESATSLTLVQPDGKSVTLLREEIEEIGSTKASLMPVGLEKDVPPAAMADLIAFLKNWRYLDGRIPLEDAAPASGNR